MDTGLKKNKILVIGSSRGIGFGIAESFVREGADVIISGRHAPELEKAALRLKNLNMGSVLLCQGDMLQQEGMETLKKMVRDKFNTLDHLVCNIGSGRSVSAGQEDFAEVYRMMNINFFHAAQSIHLFRPLLRRELSFGNEFATITLIGSICGRQVIGCPAAYAAAKAALVHYARNLAMPLAREGIRINVVSPGNILFPGSVWEQKLKDTESRVKEMLEKEVPLGKFGTPQDIGAAVVFMASRCAGFITGTELVVDGGQSR